MMPNITYEQLASFAQTGGLIYFCAVFVMVCLWAFRPQNKAAFEHAARMPLSDDDTPLAAPIPSDAVRPNATQPVKD